MGRYLNYTPTQYQSTFVPENVEGYSKILQGLQARQDTAQAAIAAQRDEILGLEYRDEVARAKALEDIKKDTDRLYTETGGNYGMNFGKVQNTISKIKEHPYMALTKEQIKQAELATKYELEHGANAWIINDPRTASLYNPETGWAKPGSLGFEAMNAEDLTKQYLLEGEHLKPVQKTIKGKAYVDPNTGNKIMEYTDVSQLPLSTIAKWVYGEGGAKATQNVLNKFPKVRDYLNKKGITDEASQVEWLNNLNMNLQRSKVVDESRTRWENLGKVEGWGVGNTNTPEAPEGKTYPQGAVQGNEDLKTVDKLEKNLKEVNSIEIPTSGDPRVIDYQKKFKEQSYNKFINEDLLDLRTKYPWHWKRYKDNPEEFLKTVKNIADIKATKQIEGHTINAGDADAERFFNSVAQDIGNSADYKIFKLDKETQEEGKSVKGSDYTDILDAVNKLKSTAVIVPEKGQVRIVYDGTSYSYKPDLDTQNLLNKSKALNEAYENPGLVGEGSGKSTYKVGGLTITIDNRNVDDDGNKPVYFTGTIGEKSYTNQPTSIQTVNKYITDLAKKTITGAKSQK